jgi:hypothetical protein
LRTRFIGEMSIPVLPGQYYDAENRTYYNYLRDFDAATGRYEQIAGSTQKWPRAVEPFGGFLKW